MEAFCSKDLERSIRTACFLLEQLHWEGILDLCLLAVWMSVWNDAVEARRIEG